MTKEEAKKRLKVWLICMDCPEDKLCYDSYLQSTCEYTDYCEDVSISEAIKVAIESLDSETVTEFADRCKECGAEAGRTLAALTKIQTIVNEWEKDTWKKEKIGKWEILPKSEFDSSTKDHIRCTNCGREPFGDIPYMFCPNCGVKMESEGK